MRGRVAVSVATLVMSFGVAQAQPPAPADVFTWSTHASGSPGEPQDAGVFVGFSGPLDIVAVEPMDTGEAITGMPYSAEATTEIVQELADGNRLERRTTSSVARDGRGRVRREQELAGFGPLAPGASARMVTIADPVQGVHYLLDSTRKVAVRTPRPVGAGSVGARRIVRRAGPPPPPPPPPPSSHASDMPPPPPPALPSFGPSVSATFNVPLPEPRTEPLGSREINGVRVDGTRTTLTIAAGAIGNERPLDTVTERWFSPELRIVVMSRRSDPRTGTVTYQLTNIQRGEPPADLFEVPSDYTIDDRPPFRARRQP